MGEAELEIHPLTPDRWDDLVTVFDRPGDPKGCWCMFYRVRSRDFDRLWGQGARAAFGMVVADGPPPGLLAYRDGTPVGWVAVALRDAMPPGSLYLLEGTAEDSGTELLTGGAPTVNVSKASHG